MKPRRWFRFSLRTMFALMLLVAIPMGWVAAQLKWIHDRRVALRWIEDHRQAAFYMKCSWADERRIATNPEFSNGVIFAWLDITYKPVATPWPLRPFGEKGVSLIGLWSDKFPASDVKKRQLERLFPEAEIKCERYGNH